MADNTIYLASRSPRRRELLKQIGVSFEMLLLRVDPRRGPDVDETPLPQEDPEVYAQRVARAKAEFALEQVARRALRARPVLAADTIVVLDERIIGKPDDAEDAARILAALSGRAHRVISVVVVGLKEQLETRMSVSSVWMRALAPEEIRRYVATGEPLDKAGAYAVQGRAAAFIERIEGSYTGIVGLPLAETVLLLRRFGVAAC